LAPLAQFRDKLLLAFALVSKEVLEGEKLLKWLQHRSSWNSLKWLLPLSLSLAVVNISLFILHSLELIPPIWIFSLLLYGGIYFLNLKYLNSIFGETVFLEGELNKFKVILRYLEKYPYRNHDHLAKLCQPFWEPKNRPSVQLAKLKRIVVAIGLRMNPVIAIIFNALIPWDFYFAYRSNICKIAFVETLPVWLDTWFELEALVSLANFAYINPDYTFPEIVFKKTQVILQAKNLGHPLIPADERVCNDFTLNNVGEIALITGSNMSGKSTFLKTLGSNLCLAYAGSPVNAAYLKTTLFRLYTCIKVNDSVTDGISYFYAEVKRLKALLKEITRNIDYPIFYLIDELFKGTNNRERIIGGRSYIRALVGKKGLGAIATHDLELTKLANSISSLKNYHFCEQVQNRRMTFDYKIHPGPCPTTNALKIMRMQGLPVDE